MTWLISIIHMIFFFVLCPGVLVSLPPKGSKYVVAATHAVIFGILSFISHSFIKMYNEEHEEHERHERPKCGCEGACEGACGAIKHY